MTEYDVSHGLSVISDCAVEKIGKGCSNVNTIRPVDKENGDGSVTAEAARSKAYGFTHVRPLLSLAVRRIQALYDKNAVARLKGLPTGFPEIDRITQGLQPGQLILVAGYPSVGKTAFALNLVSNIASLTNQSVGMFSMGLSGEQLSSRLIAATSGIKSLSLNTGKLTDHEWSQMSFALGELDELPIYINDAKGLSPEAFEFEARQLHKRCRKLGCVVIDSLQLMSAQGRKKDWTLRPIKDVANDLNVPVVVFLQLPTSVKSRWNKRPSLSDLEDCGIDIQDADSVLFLFRDGRGGPVDNGLRDIAECIVAKQDSGPPGTVKLSFRKDTLCFQSDDYR